MTGEITLRGLVLPIGGLKEKTLAAMRAGIETVIIPKLNEKDIPDLPAEVRQQLKILPVENVDELLKAALEESPSSKPEGNHPLGESAMANQKQRKKLTRVYAAKEKSEPAEV